MFFWEEVECLGVCVNVLMVQIFKDIYEDLMLDSFNKFFDDIEVGNEVILGLQNGCCFVMVEGGQISLIEFDDNF